MRLDELQALARAARGQGKYLLITYNGTMRDVYPISLRMGPGGWRMYAWCTLHPQEVSESFLLSKIGFSEVSSQDAYFVPTGLEEI